MPDVMMLSREVRHVPADFDWPLHKTWGGYLMPDELQLPRCEACDGSGYSWLARHWMGTAYRHQVRDADVAWLDKLSQAEVDYLLEQGRLRTWVRDSTEPGHGHWESRPLAAADVNEAYRDRRAMLHDAINMHLVARFKCEKAGESHLCPACNGAGDTGTTAQRAAHEAWQPTEPPTGDHIQMWQTISEGSPITPPFPGTEEGRRAMAEYLHVDQQDTICSEFTVHDWLNVIEGQVHGVGVQTGEPV